MSTLPTFLQGILDQLRQKRGFDCATYLQKKTDLILEYFCRCGLDSVVLGLSGGVDSAVALGVMRYAQKQKSSPIKKILPLLLPIHGRGATGQERARRRGEAVAKALGVEAWSCDLSAVQQGYVRSFPETSSAWAEGQLLSIVRTPALYYAAAMLQEKGFRSLVVGTTNRDEGAYLGFFGKASDAMVDLQPISDLHKSEVWALAKHLGVPKEVIEAPPSGDVFDGRNDVEMMGAPYDFVELFLMARAQGISLSASHCSKEEEQLFLQYQEALEEQHKKNAHKYWVGSPAVHLDVLPRGVPGGWKCTFHP